MASKIKKFLKKAGKAALLGAAGYAAYKGMGAARKAKLSKAVSGTDDAGIGVKHFPDYIKKKITPPKKWDIPHDKVFGDVSKGDFGVGFSKGGRTAAKHGGRTRKQFGGGLNRPVARPIGGVGVPVRPGTYKHGGKVKSMGIAKRGGGVAKR